MNDTSKICFQFNQVEIAFKELGREEMEDSESFDTLSKCLEKARIGVRSYTCATFFKQIEESIACV